jgi:hypothetical protein
VEAPLLVELVRDVGVPFTVLVLVLLRLEPKLDAQTKAVQSLTEAVMFHVRLVRGLGERPGSRED